jgi:hypothetical protein
MTALTPLMLPYIDPNGFAQDRTQEVPYYSGNGPLRTAEWCVALDEAGELTEPFKGQFASASLDCWETGIGFAKEPTHWRDSQDSVDNLVGHIVIATWCRREAAIGLWLGVGQQGFKLPGIPQWLTRYYYPNEPQYRLKYDWRAHFFKFFAARAAAHWTVGESAGWLLNAGWVFTIATTGLWSDPNAGEQDAFILSDLLIAHARRLGYSKGLYGWAIKQAETRRARKYPGGKTEVSAYYFRHLFQVEPNWEHGLVKAYKLLAERRAGV